MKRSALGAAFSSAKSVISSGFNNLSFPTFSRWFGQQSTISGAEAHKPPQR
jgi:hypothetical protein